MIHAGTAEHRFDVCLRRSMWGWSIGQERREPQGVRLWWHEVGARKLELYHQSQDPVGSRCGLEQAPADGSAHANRFGPCKQLEYSARVGGRDAEELCCSALLAEDGLELQGFTSRAPRPTGACEE